MAYLVFTVEYLADFSEFLQSDPDSLNNFDPEQRANFDEYAPPLKDQPQKRVVAQDSFMKMKEEMQQLRTEKFEQFNRTERLKAAYQSAFNTNAMAALAMKALSASGDVVLLGLEYSEGNQAAPIFKGKVQMTDAALNWTRTDHPTEDDPICVIVESFFAHPDRATNPNPTQQSQGPLNLLPFDPFFVWRVWESDADPVIHIPDLPAKRNGAGGGDMHKV